MNKQEEIRSELRRISCRWCEEMSYCKSSCGCPESDLESLSELGVVIKVHREYPEDQLNVEYMHGEYTVPGYGREFYSTDQEALDKAGYVAVEPLIEEAKNGTKH